MAPRNPLVSIISLTFNHASYIRAALDSFLTQDASFPFEIIVHDDASTDGTSEIIREYVEKYPDIVIPIIQTENQFSIHRDFAPILNTCIQRAKGSYIAFCEGDDYWTDNTKLQKQIDFLGSHPEFGMCYTDFDVLNEKNGRYTRNVFKNGLKGFQPVFNSPEEFILSQAYMCPPTWVFRKDIFPENLFGSCDGSFVMFTHFMCVSKVKYLDFTSATYRIVAESATHSSDFDKLYKRMKNILDTQLILIDHYGLDQKYKKKCHESYYRLNLVDFIINNKQDEIRKASKEISCKTKRDRILLSLHRLHLNPLLLLARNLRRTPV